MPAKVRLVNELSDIDNAGRVEMSREDVWVTVCDEGWGLKDAQVVCQQLGYTAAVGAPLGAFYGQGMR